MLNFFLFLHGIFKFFSRFLNGVFFITYFFKFIGNRITFIF